MNIVKKCSTNHTYNRKNNKIEFICIHYTAGVSSKPGKAVGTAEYFATSDTNASADFIVDDATIVQYNPDPLLYACWAVGGTKYKNTLGGKYYGQCKNMNSISIEINSNNRTGKITTPNDPNYYFTNAAVANAVELTKYLMKTYNVPADHVIRHYDVTGKVCPGIIGWNEASGDVTMWNDFKARISANTQVPAKDATAPKEQEGNKEFKVRVKIKNLNMRRKPGMKGPIFAQTGLGVFTIVEVCKIGEKEEWGLLKSYQRNRDGWIYLSDPRYTERL